jgi:putative ABC transport system permease protein
MLWSTLLLAFRALRRNSLRSALTMLGIVIGVAAVIAIVTLGNGASARVSAGVSSLGDRLLFVNPGTNLGGPQRGVTVRQFTVRDVDAIQRDVAGVEAVSPTSNTPVTAVYGNNHWPVNVTGVTKDYFSVRNAAVVRGTEFDEGQYQSGRLVCIIGKTVR